jgi:hypothetical protein
MATPSLRPRALAAGATSGLLAAVVAVAPQLGDVGASRVPEYAALLVVLVGTHAGSRFAVRARPEASFAARIGSMTTTATVAALALCASLWALYALWRPDLLASRYAALLAGAVSPEAHADMMARRAQYVDPLFEALSHAVTAFFFAFMVGGYGVFRWRVAARVAAARRGPASG